MVIEEVISCRMCSPTSRKALIDFEFHRMDEIREVCTVVDEERGQMVSHEVLVSALAVDLGRESMGISSTLASADTRHNYREAREDLADCTLLHPACPGKIAPVAIGLEFAICTMAESVDYAFGCPLSVEVQHLFTYSCIFQDIVASRTGAEGV